MNINERFSGDWETKRLGDISDINPQNFSSNTECQLQVIISLRLNTVDSGKLLGHSEETGMHLQGHSV